MKKNEFNHNEFYDWCLSFKNKNIDLYISELYMPENGFEIVWTSEKRVTGSIEKNKQLEKLWTIRK